ncbi:hypothetical protein Q5752_006549 [Cryptotrichosporon argae]
MAPPVLLPNTHLAPRPSAADRTTNVNLPCANPEPAPLIPADVERLFSAPPQPGPSSRSMASEGASPTRLAAGDMAVEEELVNVAFVPPPEAQQASEHIPHPALAGSSTTSFTATTSMLSTTVTAAPIPVASDRAPVSTNTGSAGTAPVLANPAPSLRVFASASVPAGKRKRKDEDDESNDEVAYDFGPSLDLAFPGSSSSGSLPLVRARTIGMRPRGSQVAVPVLPTPLPSKRLLKKRTARALLIRVEQLPVFALPLPPPITDEDTLKMVFTHHSLFEKARGVFEDPEGRPARHYEKLEHVGDSILGMVVTTWLHEIKPRLTCGTATKLKAHLVSNATLSHLSGLYNFPQRLNGDPRLLSVLRAQTDVRAALMEAYIAGLYFSCPVGERLTVALPRIDAWLRDMYEPLLDFFLRYMESEHCQHHAATGAGADGVVRTAADQAALDAADRPAEGMALLVQMFGKTMGRDVVWDAERFETSVGVLWRITCLVDGIEMGDGTRAIRKRAKDVAGFEAAKKLGLAVSCRKATAEQAADDRRVRSYS